MKNLSKGEFIPRKDPTRLARIAAMREANQYAVTDTGDVLVLRGGGEQREPAKKQKPKYFGHRPTRNSHR